MIVLVVLVAVCLYVFCFPFRIFVGQPIEFLVKIPIDIYAYFSKYKWIPKKPFINVYCGLFGSGKTLSAVHDVIGFYKQYNNRIVYDDRVNNFVLQKVFILSNVDLKGVPYIQFTSLQQLVDISKYRHETDKKTHRRTITIVLGDEFSVQMNSRSFKNNIDALFLNSLLTSRHALIHGFFLTSQRFEHMDALLRQVSTNVIQCKKVWRLQKNVYFDAYTLEHCSDPTKCEKIAVTGFFVRNRDYNSYDTLQVVQNLVKACNSGDMMTEEEIIQNMSAPDRFAKEDKKKGILKGKKK